MTQPLFLLHSPVRTFTYYTFDSFLLSPFLFFDIMRISRGVDSHTTKKALSSKVLILKEKSRGCYWT